MVTQLPASAALKIPHRLRFRRNGASLSHCRARERLLAPGVLPGGSASRLVPRCSAFLLRCVNAGRTFLKHSIIYMLVRHFGVRLQRSKMPCITLATSLGNAKVFSFAYFWAVAPVHISGCCPLCIFLGCCPLSAGTLATVPCCGAESACFSGRVPCNHVMLLKDGSASSTEGACSAELCAAVP